MLFNDIWNEAAFTVIFWGIVFAAMLAGVLFELIRERRGALWSLLLRRYRLAQVKIERRRRISARRRHIRREKQRLAARRRVRLQRERAYRRALAFCNRGICDE